MKITNELVISKAKEIGFDLVGFAKADLLEDEIKKYDKWIEANYQSGMGYMDRNREKRKDVSQVLPGAKSVVSLAINYYSSEEYSNNKKNGKVSRYAWGKDYHLIINEMLEKLESFLSQTDPDFKSISYVDTGPVMDKAWAVRAGIGWLGKHTNVINRDLGSWFFIANIITNIEFKYSERIPDFCGSCTACIDACPTNAIAHEYILDSNRCISYLTIENKGEIPSEFSGEFDNWIFGCDICQDVCPWNEKFSIISSNSEFLPKNSIKEIPLSEIDQMDEGIFAKRFKDSPVRRAKLKGLKRNAEFVIKNTH
jgi:epoxyqueuosine reductase